MEFWQIQIVRVRNANNTVKLCRIVTNIFSFLLYCKVSTKLSMCVCVRACAIITWKNCSRTAPQLGATLYRETVSLTMSLHRDEGRNWDQPRSGVTKRSVSYLGVFLHVIQELWICILKYISLHCSNCIKYGKFTYFINLLLIFSNNSGRADIWPFISSGVQEVKPTNDSFLKHRQWISDFTDLQGGDLQGGDLQSGANKEESDSHDGGRSLSSL